MRSVRTALWVACVAVACGGGAPGDDPPDAVAADAAASAARARVGDSAAESPFAPQPGTPVLLVTIDTLRWDALGSYGGTARTPALDRLAAEGARFERAVAHAVLTLPSHTSILSGLDPSRHGVHDNAGYRAPDALRTWAERLSAAGYTTGAFVGAFPLDSQFGLQQGFDVYDDRYGVGQTTVFHMIERSAEAVVDNALAWIGEQDSSWFAWVHVYDPHAPYAPPEPFASDYAGELYAGEVAYTDAALAPLLEAARERDAIVVVTSDHGESLGEHGELTHGLLAYESTVRVPLIVAWPEHIPAAIVATRARHIDILPTVLELIGLPTRGVDGQSLNGAIAGRDVATLPSYFESLSPNLTRNWAPLYGWYDGDLKMIDVPIAELYAVAIDPGETDNLAAARAADLERMRAALNEHLLAGAEADAAGVTDPATLRRLRALGYLTGQAGGAREYGPDDDPKRLIGLDNQIQEAVAASDAGDHDRAAELLDRVLRQRPDNISAYSVLAAVEHARGDTRAAIDLLSAAAAAGHSHAALLGDLAYYQQAVGELDDAVASLEAALAADASNLEFLNLLARTHDMAGRDAEARTALDRALGLDPTWGTLHATRGIMFLSTGQVVQARGAFERAVELDPAQAEAHNGLGVISAQAGDLEAAVEHWRRAASADPMQLDALNNLASTLLRLRRFREAIPVIRDLVERVPPERAGEFQIDLRRTQLRDLVRDFGG